MRTQAGRVMMMRLMGIRGFVGHGTIYDVQARPIAVSHKEESQSGHAIASGYGLSNLAVMRTVYSLVSEQGSIHYVILFASA